jgi:hypothetical protein
VVYILYIYYVKYCVLFAENAATPYAATVIINSMQYGVGYGTSKKQAKSEAARATLEILIPEMREKIQEDKRVGARGTSKGQDSDLSVSRRVMLVDVEVLIYMYILTNHKSCCSMNFFIYLCMKLYCGSLNCTQ